MKLQAATGHAIRILGYLAEGKGRLMTATEMSERLGITYLYFMKITGYLKRAGLVISEQGCNGGYRLAKKIENISVYDVVRAIEGELSIDKRILESNMREDECYIHDFFNSVQDNMIDQMEKIHISDLFAVPKKKMHVV
ncbi:MAG: Rrf2 family transcriptional regulator [Christensenella sp.]